MPSTEDSDILCHHTEDSIHAIYWRQYLCQLSKTVFMPSIICRDTHLCRYRRQYLCHLLYRDSILKTVFMASTEDRQHLCHLPKTLFMPSTEDSIYDIYRRQYLWMCHLPKTVFMPCWRQYLCHLLYRDSINVIYWRQYLGLCHLLKTVFGGWAEILLFCYFPDR